jgi:hypothetical protein
VYRISRNTKEDEETDHLMLRPISPKLDTQAQLRFTCITGRWSGSQASVLLYIGDTEGGCHILNANQRYFQKSFQLFPPSLLGHKPRYKPISQLFCLLDSQTTYYIVAIRQDKRKIALLQEIN